ncbi:hypothetical protein OUZ56_031475 [Daphnia magna]|uniref:Uncharacterized protein n=1 Tax=Daphnia magna TaxID=35525 RepID=A0ABQ9ZUC6_9CRUS|nr:hypothetical protein OUZ56_031475 [Daphnia magna]
MFEKRKEFTEREWIYTTVYTINWMFLKCEKEEGPVRLNRRECLHNTYGIKVLINNQMECGATVTFAIGATPNQLLSSTSDNGVYNSCSRNAESQ